MMAECGGCGKSGATSSTNRRPAWCRCKGVAGPYVAPTGHVTLLVYMTPEQHADLQAARAIKNEYIAARDAGADARWTPSLRGRSKTSAIYRAWSRRMRAGTRALEALQAACAHFDRCLFSPHHCNRCAVYLGPIQAEAKEIT